MKKSLRKHLKKWNIGDYARQFSIVTGGVLLTLWLTGRISESARQKEVRQAMQIVMLELQDNLQVIRDYKWHIGNDRWIAECLLAADFSLDGFPQDTIEVYSRCITSGMGKPYHFATDALEMLKTTGIASHIADKQLVIDLLRCYKRIGQFDDSIGLYFDQRQQAIIPTQLEHMHWRTSFSEGFQKALMNKQVQNWISIIPRAFDTDFFTKNEESLERMIEKLENLSK